MQDIIAGDETISLALIQSELTTLQANLESLYERMESASPFADDDTREVEDYDAMFSTIELPAVASEFRDDDLFAHLRVAGPNPTLIRRLTALPAHIPLTTEILRAGTSTNDTVSSALAQGRLYICDYTENGRMASDDAVTKPMTGDGYAHAPIALFMRPRDAADLVPVAIQCGADPGQHALIPCERDPNAGAAYWRWQEAKTVVQVADFNQHEMFTHLGRTHLVGQAFAMATHRQLANQHPLNRLLAPHLEGTMHINFASTGLILAPFTTGDQVLAPTLDDLLAEIARDRLAWDFYDRLLPNDIALRGMDDPALHYPYRDDAQLVWDATRAWTDAYVSTYYASDVDVVNDTELAAFTDELAQKGKVRGIVRVTTREELSELICGIAFNASAQHAAVNYPQATYMTYAPLYAGQAGNRFPADDEVHDEGRWNSMLPHPQAASIQLGLLHVLGNVYYRRLGEYRDNVYPYPNVLLDPQIQAPLAAFNSALSDVEATISARNQARARPYPFLLPSRIPASTNI